MADLFENRFIGIVPAAGLGCRLAPLGYPKELLPISFERDFSGSGIRPRPVMNSSLELMRLAGVRRVYIVISDRKFEIARVFGAGEEQDLSVSYLMRSTPRGLADAVDAASPWVADEPVCLALPDTIVYPRSAMRETCALLKTTKADVALGVFPTQMPEQLGPVRFDENGVVTEVLEKPSKCNLQNTWAIAAWGPKFTKLLRRSNAVAGGAMPPNLGDLFQKAVLNGLDVRAQYFSSGAFFDLGTPRGLAEFFEWSIRNQHPSKERMPVTAGHSRNSNAD